jgi:hypothetical protein
MPCCLGPALYPLAAPGIFIEQDALAGFVLLHCTAPVGNQRKTRSQVRWEPSGFFPSFPRITNFPVWDAQGVCNMEAVYFVGAFLFLVALIYGTLDYHYRDKRRDRVTNQIVRDRYEHNRT